METLSPSDVTLEHLARRAYERGRLMRGLKMSAVALPLAAFSSLLHRRFLPAAVMGALLLTLVAWAVWRGRGAARGALRGMLAGAIPMLVPLALEATSRGCTGMMCCRLCSLCMPLGILGGAVAGLLVMVLSLREKEQRRTFVLAGGLAACLTGSLGCLVSGPLGVVYMLAALLLVSSPGLFVPARQ
jgi:hypothetical protein